MMNQRLKKALGLDRPLTILAVICIGFAITFIFPSYIVDTGSMDPAIPPGSFVVSVRLPLFPVPIEKNDIAIFRPAEGVSAHPWVHRIIADSGDQVTPPDRDGRVDVSAEGIGEVRGKSAQSLLIPESYFYQSGDSARSYHGLIPKSMVIGKVLFHFKLPWR
jgi:signal peptidase I